MTTVKVRYWGVHLEVEGTYIPEEKGVSYTENLDGYPGAPATFEIHEVLAGGVDILPILNWDQIKQLALDKL